MPLKPASKPLRARPDPRKRLIAKLHVVKTQRGLDDDDYRDAMELATGKRSAAAMTVEELERAIERLGGDAPRSDPSLTGPYVPKLRALWLSAWNMTVVRDRSDAAMVAFVKRQTGLDSVRWLRDPIDAKRAIEALKSWLAREGGVNWRAHPDNPRRAVAEAQWAKLSQLGAVRLFGHDMHEATAFERYGQAVTSRTSFLYYSEEDWDALIRALGKKLRHEVARRGQG